MMEGSPLFRAAGAYVQELAEEFGRLALQAAVLANMRMKDNNSYAPDPRIIPRNSRRLLMDLRRLWREARSIVPVAAAYMEDQQQIAFGEIEAITTWADPIPLARLAVGLRPLDALARITLSTTLMRNAALAPAAEQLKEALRVCDLTDRRVRVRLYRNLACAHEMTGDMEQALACIRVARDLDKADRLTGLSFLGLAVTAGSHDQVLTALRSLCVRRSAGARSSAIRFLLREYTYPQIRLARDRDMKELVTRELEMHSRSPVAT